MSLVLFPTDKYNRTMENQTFIIEEELKNYSERLYEKERWLVFNKCDLLSDEEVQTTIDEILTKLDRKDAKYFVISALSNKNVKELSYEVWDLLDEVKRKEAQALEEGKVDNLNDTFVWPTKEDESQKVPQFDEEDDWEDFDDEFFDEDEQEIDK